MHVKSLLVSKFLHNIEITGTPVIVEITGIPVIHTLAVIKNEKNTNHTNSHCWLLLLQ